MQKALFILFLLTILIGENFAMDKNAKRKIRMYTQYLKGTPSQVFPLLCPVREYEWIEFWRCKMVFSNSGYAEQDCIFKTNFPDDGPEKTWVVSEYLQNKKIAFVITNSEMVSRFSITLIHGNDNTTVAEWYEVVTALNEEGEKKLEKLTDDNYTREKKKLEELINHFLATGKMMKME